MSENSTDVNVEVAEDMETKKTVNWLQLAIYVVGGIALIFAIYFIFANRGMNTELVKERNNVTQLIEERVKLQNHVQELNMQNEKLDASLEIANEDLTAKEILLVRVNKENEILKTIKGRMMELQKVSESLSVSNGQLLKLQQDINSLIDSRQRENKKLTESLQR